MCYNGWVIGSSSIMTASAGPASCELRLEPREYQQRIVNETVGYLEGDTTSVLIESPTGSGKTDMGLMIALPFAQQGWRIGWAAMRRNLLKQVVKECQKIGFPYPITPISMFDKVATPHDLLIIDEAHHDATASMATIHGMVRPKRVLGLSATPKRRDHVGLCFQRTVRDCGIAELIQMGYLSQYNHYTIPEYTPEAVADCYMADPNRWGKSLVFFLTEAECLRCMARFHSQGFKAVDLVTGKTDRDTQLEAFEEGRTKVIVNMMVLTEGFDCSSLRTVFLRPSSKNPTIQMGGRVFRQYPGIDFKNVVQSPQTSWPMVRTAAAHSQFKWEGNEWRSVLANDKLMSIAEQNSRLMVEAAQAAIASGKYQGVIDDPNHAAISAAHAARRGRRRRRWDADVED